MGRGAPGKRSYLVLSDLMGRGAPGRRAACPLRAMPPSLERRRRRPRRCAGTSPSCSRSDSSTILCSSAFTRGRMLGQIETEAKWQLKDKAKRTKELLGLGKDRRHKKEDWSQCDTETLENKLIERKVIQVEDSNDSERKIYSPEMLEISRQCIKSSQREHSRQEMNSDHQTVSPNTINA